MNDPKPPTTSEFLVISRGQWDRDASPEAIESAIDKFYRWLEQNIAEGRMVTGSRLGMDGAVVGRAGLVTDGPFGESKEIVGGYWFILAPNLRAAAELAAQNPCAQFGLTFEIRPLEGVRASVYNVTNETAKR
ncbi:MAG: hypothetical protein IT581_08105 [Verrucomicrobiales bacterium]|nr:hypothetical protein [Verrucomicrobiales bacterium]